MIVTFFALVVCGPISRASAYDRDDEIRSAGATSAAWTVSTGLMVGLAALPIIRCDRDLACLGTGLLSIGTFVLAHPFVASGSVHLLNDAIGDHQPYWHSLLGQTAGDVLAVGTLLTAVALAPSPRTGRSQTPLRAIVFTTCALLSLAGPLIVRPLLDSGRQAPPSMMQLALKF